MSYDQVREANPGLVYASINGFGSSGPRAEEAGTEVIVEAHSGLMAMMGLPGGPPVRFGVAMVDIATGLALVNGVLAALLARSRDGAGRLIEFPLYATAISVLGTVIASSSISPDSQSERFGSGHPSIVPYAAFEASDGWMVLGAVNEPMWARLCEALGMAELASDPRCATNAARVDNREFVDGAVAGAVALADGDGGDLATAGPRRPGRAGHDCRRSYPGSTGRPPWPPRRRRRGELRTHPAGPVQHRIADAGPRARRALGRGATSVRSLRRAGSRVDRHSGRR